MQIVEADLLGLDGDFEPVDAVWTSTIPTPAKTRSGEQQSLWDMP